MIKEISVISTLVITFTGFFLNTFMLKLMTSAAPYNTNPVFTTRVLCDTILAINYSVQLLSFYITFNGYIMDNWYVCQTTGWITCMFSGLSIVSMYWAPYEQYSVVVMAYPSPSRNKAALGLCIVGMLISCFVYFGFESYHLIRDVGVCWMDTNYEASTWSRISLCTFMFFYFGPLPIALFATRQVMITLQSNTTSNRRKLTSNLLQMRILKQSRVLMIIMVLGYSYPLVFGILFLLNIPLPPVAYLFLSWCLGSLSVMHPVIQFVTDDRLRALAYTFFAGFFPTVDKDSTALVLFDQQIIPPVTLLVVELATLETKTEIILHSHKQSPE